MLFAHSLPPPHAQSDWEPLADHLQAVGHRAGGFAETFGAAAIARAAGLLHDIGKVSADYQAYIRGAAGRGPDHSTAGARAALREYGAVGQLLAFAIAGHHGGLPNGTQRGGGGTLADRLGPDYPIPHHDGWRDATGTLPGMAEVQAGVPTGANPHCPNFQLAFATRMIFSCLVDADSLETERFYAEAEGGVAPARGGTLADRHLAAIRAYMARHRREDSAVNRLRSRVLDHAVAKAALPTGLFTLTVPTGGGKTLTSLQFALEHAHRHGLTRIIYVIPFTSIIEQTAAVFRTALGTDDDILEHHSSFDWDEARPDAEGDREQEGRQGLAKLRRDAENWDSPIVVTTAVQFFESLFTAKRGRARKLHNLAKSVIVLDEAQTMPVHLLRPCMAALDELTRNYGTSVVLCTATQPALRQCDGALPDGMGFALDDERELAPDVRGLFKALHRVDVEWRREPVADEAIAARFGEQPQMLTIVNSRAHAAKLFAAIADQPGARHLTTLMCARHRRRVLAEVREDLKEGRPVRLVATSLIEAGVDVDFPEVWRAAAGLDSIAQAAGRCNREGRLPVGRTVVFEPAEAGVPRAMCLFWEAARPVLRGGDDPLGVDAVRAYFRELYFRKGAEALDAATLRGEPFPILHAIEHGVRPHDDFKFAFPFADIGEAFRLIDQVMDPVLVPYDDEAKAALEKLQDYDRPPVAVLRKLQQFTVPVPSEVRAAMLATGAAQAIRPEDYGDRFIALESLALYDERTGLKLDDPTSRSGESNIIS